MDSNSTEIHVISLADRNLESELDGHFIPRSIQSDHTLTHTQQTSRHHHPIRYKIMSTEHISLDAAATERKARLAKLASLKRKRPDADAVNEQKTSEEDISNDKPTTEQYVSGRNYDIATRGPKLGFEQEPSAHQETVEQEAARISAAAAEQAAKDEADAEKGIDLFKLQPKKPNWDLKRDLAERMKVVDVRTQNAIARLVRERIQKAKQEAQNKTAGTKPDGGEELGVEGNTLVEAVHLREKEDEEDRDKQHSDEEEGVS